MLKKDMMNLLEAMKQRRSVRSFNGEPLSEACRSALTGIIRESSSPFGGDVEIRLKEFDARKGFRPVTYGMIKGACDFFLVGFGDGDAAALSAGFRFEQVVLRAWQLGLGTCWIAATFRESDFGAGESWPAGVKLKVVCPVGTAAGKSIVERIARLAAGSKNRKPFDKLFFYGDFSHPVPGSDRYRESLEMVRLAPSSTNSQPWRALVAGGKVHFYCRPNSRWSVLDCGIGLCHFYETERFHGRSGRFLTEADAPQPPDGWKYLSTYIP